jgi:hypothetical protein
MLKIWVKYWISHRWQAKKAFIQSFIKEIVTTGEDALLTYTFPMQQESLRREFRF